MKPRNSHIQVKDHWKRLCDDHAIEGLVRQDPDLCQIPYDGHRWIGDTQVDYILLSDIGSPKTFAVGIISYFQKMTAYILTPALQEVLDVIAIYGIPAVETEIATRGVE
jgi:hypothetical protein